MEQKLPEQKHHSIFKVMSRKPEPIRPARIAPLSRLPAFFALQGKRVIVAGDSDAAAWKVELLAAAGARVDVFAPRPCDGMIAPIARTTMRRRNSPRQRAAPVCR